MIDSVALDYFGKRRYWGSSVANVATTWRLLSKVGMFSSSTRAPHTVLFVHMPKLSLENSRWAPIRLDYNSSRRDRAVRGGGQDKAVLMSLAIMFFASLQRRADDANSSVTTARW
jgi:hypothetical protein